jgi:hypothetical protein
MDKLAVIPTATDMLPTGWWERTILPVADRIDDVAQAQEMARRLAALGQYVKNRQQRFELVCSALELGTTDWLDEEQLTDRLILLRKVHTRQQKCWTDPARGWELR